VITVLMLSLVFAAWGGPRNGFLLQVQDPSGFLQADASITLKGSAGSWRQATLVDDGEMPDILAGDNIYTQAVPTFPDEQVTFTVTSADRSWTGKATLDPDDVKALVRLRLTSDGRATQVQAPTPSGAPPPTASATQGPQTPVAETVQPAAINLGPGAIVWALCLVAAAAGAGLGLVVLGRRARSPAALRVQPADPIAPLRLLSDQVDAALGGPLARHRVVVHGPLDGTYPHVVQCEEIAPLPIELVAAVQGLAVQPGPPVALLLTRPDGLDSPGPVDPLADLARLVAGRFPVWVVDGPTDWEPWQDQAGHA